MIRIIKALNFPQSYQTAGVPVSCLGLGGNVNRKKASPPQTPAAPQEDPLITAVTFQRQSRPLRPRRSSEGFWGAHRPTRSP